MQYWKSSTLLQIPEDKRQVVYDSGVYMVNDCFIPLYEKKAFRKHLFGGRGTGKSHHVSDYVDWLLDTKEYCRVLFLRYISEDIKDSLWADFVDRLTEKDRLKDYRLVDNEKRAFNLKTGNKLVSKGVKSSKAQTAKLKSIAGFTHVIIEEADEIPLLDKQKLIDSVRKKGVEIEIVESWNTARKTHHIYDDYTLTPVPGNDGYFTAVPKPDINILSIWADYNSNRHNLNDEFLQRYDNGHKAKDNNWYLTDVCGYIPSGLTGQIYKGWNRISLAEYNALDYNKYYYLDWGTNDECAIGEVKIHNRTMLVKGLHYKPTTKKDDLVLDVAIFLAKSGFTTKENIICDSSQPRSILQLQGYERGTIDDYLFEQYPQLAKGFSTIGVSKPPGSVKDGINILKGFDIYVVEDEESEHVWSEYLEYVWELDKDGKPTDQPVDKKNHHMDGIRYVGYFKDNL